MPLGSAVQATFLPTVADDQQPLWTTLRETEAGLPLGLWELPDEILHAILMVGHYVRDNVAHRVKANQLLDKYRIGLESVQTILRERQHPRGLIRRVDFVPHSLFASELVTLDMLVAGAAFHTGELEWLTKATQLPAVQTWPGINMAEQGLELPALICLFARAMKNDCFASIQLGPVLAVHEARLTESGLLRIMDPQFGSKASLHKGHLVWVAKDDDLYKRFDEEWAEGYMQWQGLGNEAFCKNFAVGALHVVEGMDVTNSKMRLKPKLFADLVDEVVEEEKEEEGQQEHEASNPQGTHGQDPAPHSYPGSSWQQPATSLQSEALVLSGHLIT